MDERFIRIEDAGDKRLDAYFRLTNASLRSKLEPEKGLFIAEAQTVIEVALDSGCYPVSLLCDERLINDRTRALIGRCFEINGELPVYTASGKTFEQLTGFELTRGLLAAMRRPEEKDAKALCASSRRAALLEGIADTTNLGAIMRSAAGMGIDAVLLTSDCCDPLLRRAIRVSMGTVFKIDWAYVKDSAEALRLLHENGFRCAAMALREDALPLSALRPEREEKVALLLGSEGWGLKNETIEASDCTVVIPMKKGVDSLNVAAAAAVAFWQITGNAEGG